MWYVDNHGHEMNQFIFTLWLIANLAIAEHWYNRSFYHDGAMRSLGIPFSANRRPQLLWRKKKRALKEHNPQVTMQIR